MILPSSSQIGWQTPWPICTFAGSCIEAFRNSMASKTLRLSFIETEHPLGPILIASDNEMLVALDFDSPEGRLRNILQPRYGRDLAFTEDICPAHIAVPIRAYLDGRLDALDQMPIDPGGTAFQRQVWAALRTIPAGTTLSYGAMAAHLGRPDAPRAVGSANALNPISIVVPCHRLVGSNGALTGYGGGIQRKQWLLDHERGSG
jgi:methylated-DNA-[protein]-cysteine S-methyltransferase